jgi:hypothetical protein
LHIKEKAGILVFLLLLWSSDSFIMSVVRLQEEVTTLVGAQLWESAELCGNVLLSLQTTTRRRSVSAPLVGRGSMQHTLELLGDVAVGTQQDRRAVVRVSCIDIHSTERHLFRFCIARVWSFLGRQVS